MVSDSVFTINSTARTFAVSVFDGTTVIRNCEVSDDNMLTSIVSHEDTKSGITRTLAKLREDFVHSTLLTEESASVHLVLTYKTGEGKAKAKLLADGLMDWLQANTNENLTSIGAKQYGES